jgi:hypothetical protein
MAYTDEKLKEATKERRLRDNELISKGWYNIDDHNRFGVMMREYLDRNCILAIVAGLLRRLLLWMFTMWWAKEMAGLRQYIRRRGSVTVSAT